MLFVLRKFFVFFLCVTSISLSAKIISPHSLHPKKEKASLTKIMQEGNLDKLGKIDDVDKTRFERPSSKPLSLRTKTIKLLKNPYFYAGAFAAMVITLGIATGILPTILRDMLRGIILTQVRRPYQLNG